MLETSAAYQEAIVGGVRYIVPRAVMEVIDPDISFGTATGSAQGPYSKPEELHDRVYEAAGVFATGENGVWGLDGSVDLYDGIPAVEQGWMGDAMCGTDGTFDEPQVVIQPFTGVGTLQAASVWFALFPPADFTVEILSESTVVQSWSVTDNTQMSFSAQGFTVYNPTSIRVTVTKMARPETRLRVAEIVPGVYEQWQGRQLTELRIKHEVDPSCLSLPYGTCSVGIDNRDRRFEPRRRDGLFQMLEARQAMKTRMGVRLADRSVEYVPTGVFFMSGDGYKTGKNNATITWDLVDIIGLIAQRTYIVPSPLPTTAAGWLASIVAQLGDNFANLYQIDQELGETPLTCSADDVTNVTCGDLARWVCMAIQAYPRANAETGALEAAVPARDASGRIKLSALTVYPTMKANEDVAALIFDLQGETFVVGGTQGSSSKTVNIKNPFISTQETALKVARYILQFYGGNRFELTGRGDMSCEMGDIDRIDLDERSAANGRRISQELSLKDGIMANVPSTLITATGAFTYTNYRAFTEDEDWTGPDGVTEVYLILVQGGWGGEAGTAGKNGTAGWNGGEGNDDGTPGKGGRGGLVFAGTVNINEGQTFSVHIGAGGEPGKEGGHTTFGGWSSASGVQNDAGVADVLGGDVYGQAGTEGIVSSTPVPGAAGPANSGFGGNGGSAGVGGVWANVVIKVIDGNTGKPIPNANPQGVTMPVLQQPATQGAEGGAGGSGIAIVYWEE